MFICIVAGPDGFKVGQAARKSAQRSRPHSRALNDVHMHTEVAFVLRLYRIFYVKVVSGPAA